MSGFFSVLRQEQQIAEKRMLHVAVEGCAHGDLENIYSAVRYIQGQGLQLDLLICCGDFQVSALLSFRPPSLSLGLLPITRIPVCAQ